MPSVRPPPTPSAPPPEELPPAAPLLARAGSLFGTGTLAALLGAIPAAARAAHDGGGALRAWTALAACAVIPLVGAVAFARTARDGARSVTGDEAPLVPWAIATWAMMSFLALAAFGAVLRATTHHHGLAGVTFAIGGLLIGGALALVVRRLLQMARAADPWGRSALVVCVMALLICALLVVVFRVARAGGAEVPSAALVDTLAFVIAAGALSRQTFARITWLAVAGLPVAAGVLGLGWALLARDPALVEAIGAHAPLFAPMARLLLAVA
jgi:choline-sulfatase